MATHDVSNEMVRLVENTKTELSLLEVRFLEAVLNNQNEWLTKKEWAYVSGINHWTIPRMLARFMVMGFLEREGILPSVFYRFNQETADLAQDIKRRYARALEILKTRERKSPLVR